MLCTLQEYTMNKNLVMDWLKTTPISLTEISKNTGISRNTLHVWINGGTPRQRNIDKLVNVYRRNIHHESKLLLRGGKLQMKDSNIDYDNSTDHSGSISSKYVIELQKDKIEQQEKELVMLKRIIEQQPLQKMKFDEVEADMQTTVEMKNIFSLKPIQRKIYNIEGTSELASKLSIPNDVLINQYFQPHTWHATDDHPVDKLICKSTLKELKQMTKRLPTILDSLKWVAGLHYMVTPVKYINGEHYCNTLCYILLDWKSKPVKVLSKTIFMNGNS